MTLIGVVGLGDMGSGLAKNLIQNGYETVGFDLSDARMRALKEMGGTPAANITEVGEKADAVFVMVMNGDQAKQVILDGGLKDSLTPGACVILTATIKPSEARDIARGLDGTGIHIVDAPVSGGFAGAQNGKLTMMAAGKTEVLDEIEPIMLAVSAKIHRVGEEVGAGQTVKAVLQSLIGSIFTATFEACALGAKAGVEGQVILDVISTSGAGCGVANNAIEQIIDRKFSGTGSAIGTMYKDLTITLDMARELGVPLFTAATAMQLFQAGKTKYPNGDNWIVTRVLEDIVGEELHRNSNNRRST